MRIFLRKKGQSTAEYAIVIGIVVAAAIAMQTYMKRSLQSGIKFAVDKSAKAGSTAAQYEPYYQKSDYDTTVSAYQDTEATVLGGGVTKTYGVTPAQRKTVSRTGTQQAEDATGAD